MNKETAKKLLEKLNECNRCLDESVAIAQAECEENDFKSYRSAVAKIMGVIILQLKEPIYGQFPDLSPKDEN